MAFVFKQLNMQVPLTPDLEETLLESLEEHIVRHQLRAFTVVFGGDEPLLWGKLRLVRYCQKLARITDRVDCAFQLFITTRGALVDEEWSLIFRMFGIRVTVRIDSPKVPSRVLYGFQQLRNQQLEPRVLVVCDPNSDPRELIDFIIEEWDTHEFEVAIPTDPGQAIAPFYRELFDIWHQELSPNGVEIRLFHHMVKSLLGYESQWEEIGSNPVETLVVQANGTLGADPAWVEVHKASQTLHPKCQTCAYAQACGGGPLASRWTAERRYNNPSRHCDDLYDLFSHIVGRMSESAAVGKDVLFSEWFEANKFLLATL